MTNDPSVWSKDWPNAVGWWWFFGHRFGGQERRFYCVEVIEVPHGLVCVGHGHIWYRNEGHIGIWRPVVLPEVPEEKS